MVTKTIKPEKVYVMEHKVTGKLYFGHTSRNIKNYNGSGPKWIEHLKENGYEINKHVLLETDDPVLLEKKCIEWSKLFDIVDSDLFLNEVEERGGSLGGRANPNYKDGKWVGRHDDKELERRLYKEADAIKYERDKDLFVKHQMNARYHKSKNNKERAKEYFDKWQAGIRGKDPNGKSLQKTDTFEFWYQCKGSMSWAKREEFYG